MKRSDDSTIHFMAGAVTLAFHAAIVMVVASMTWRGCGSGSTAAALEKDDYHPIEAGLAIKSKSSGKKSSLPTKDVQQKVKPPDGPKVATDPTKAEKLDQQKKKDPQYTPPDAVDAKSIMEKYRNKDIGSAFSKDPKAADETTEKGSVDGSEYGTLETAKGDPYVGELIGRMTKDFTVPSVVTETGLETWGCVKLDETGKVVDKLVPPEHKSKVYAFNSAVEQRLKQTTDMDKPVPDHLKKMLVGKYVCATYRND